MRSGGVTLLTSFKDLMSSAYLIIIVMVFEMLFVTMFGGESFRIDFLLIFNTLMVLDIKKQVGYYL